MGIYRHADFRWLVEKNADEKSITCLCYIITHSDKNLHIQKTRITMEQSPFCVFVLLLLIQTKITIMQHNSLWVWSCTFRLNLYFWKKIYKSLFRKIQTSFSKNSLHLIFSEKFKPCFQKKILFIWFLRKIQNKSEKSKEDKKKKQ